MLWIQLQERHPEGTKEFYFVGYSMSPEQSVTDVSVFLLHAVHKVYILQPSYK